MTPSFIPFFGNAMPVSLQGNLENIHMQASGRDLRLPCAAIAAGALACGLLPAAGAFIAPPQARAPGAAPKAGDPWYTFKAQAGNTVEIEIYGIIGEAYDWWTGEKVGVSAQSFIDELKPLDENTDLELHINSLGGDVFDGATIYNRLVQWKGKVTVVIDGVAASAASVIAMAGSTIKMPPTAMLMIHNPWTFAMGEAADFRKAAETLDTIRSAMMAAYQAKNPTMPEADLIAALDAETWYTATAAVDAGFADEVIEASGPSAQASIFRASLKRFQNVPQALLDAAVDDAAKDEVTETTTDEIIVEDVVEEIEAPVVDTVDGDEPLDVEPTDPADPATPAPEGDLQEQVAALAATVQALTARIAAQPAPEEPKAKVDAKSPAVVAMRSVAALSGRGDEFDDAVAAGRTLAELQKRFVEGGSQAQVSTSAIVPDPASVKPQGSTSKPKSAAEIFAIRKAQREQQNRK